MNWNPAFCPPPPRGKIMIKLVINGPVGSAILRVATLRCRPWFPMSMVRPNDCACWMVRLDNFRCFLIPETTVATFLTKNTCVDYYINLTSRPAEACKLNPTRPSGLGLYCCNKTFDILERKWFRSFFRFQRENGRRIKQSWQVSFVLFMAGSGISLMANSGAFADDIDQAIDCWVLTAQQDLDWNHVSK
jgi:hypothetical protein